MNAKASESDPGTLGIRLLALLEKISRRARKQDVHRLRTTVRRLEVHVPNPPKKLAKSLKKLRKKAGKVRDVDVHLDLLKPPLPPVNGRKTAAPRAQEKLRSILEGKRDRERSRLRELVKQFTPLLESRLPGVIEQLREPDVPMKAARKRASRARQRFLKWTKQVPEDAQRLHRLRIDTKRLRYELEPFPLCPEAVSLVKKFKQVQDAIGAWHDWATLQQLAEQHLSSSAAVPVVRALQARSGREFRRARRSAESARSWMMQPPAVHAGPRLVRKAG